MVERAHASSFMDYYGILERDIREYRSFLSRLTINVSELFRNPEKWDELGRLILPGLLERRSRLRIWSAGCSYGAEPYSLAITLAQIHADPVQTLRATDVDQTILAKAGEGNFTAPDVRNVDAAALGRFFVPVPPDPHPVSTILPEISPAYRATADLRARVDFAVHDLLRDRFETDYDLICCRNVVIYFTDSAKDRLFRRFYTALAPGGVLFLGASERIFRYREIGFENPIPFFYRKPG